LILVLILILIPLQIMVAILRDMVFALDFLCTPIELESAEEFQKRTAQMSGEEQEEAKEALFQNIITVMSQKEPIRSILPKSLFQTIDTSYIRHISEDIGFFGVPEGTDGYDRYMKGFSAYYEEVKVALLEKASSSRTCGHDSVDIMLANNHLVTKWEWLCKDVLSGFHWSSQTSQPLLTQTFIKNMDGSILEIAPAFEEVRRR
jgi:hypothetical protein